MITKISEQFYNAHQSWNYEVISQRHDGLKLKVSIRRNAYDDQSYVRGYALDPVHFKWNLIVDDCIEFANCAKASYVNKHENAEPFEMDADNVFEKLTSICPSQ